MFDPDTFSSSEVALVRLGAHPSGVQAECIQGFNSPHFTSQTIDRLLSNTLIKSTQKVHTKNYTSLAAIQASASTSQLIDVLISNTWPSSIADASSSIHPILSSLPPSTFAPILDEVTRKTRPRYHLVSSTKFWEREPYVWTDEGQKRTSRFISLGNFGGINSNNGEKKQRVGLFIMIKNCAHDDSGFTRSQSRRMWIQHLQRMRLRIRSPRYLGHRKDLCLIQGKIIYGAMLAT